MIYCIHHNKDMDGYTSGAVVKRKYPDAILIGWDYKDPIPDFVNLIGEDVILIDITFPMKDLIELGKQSNLTVIDHHISFKKQIDELDKFPFDYIYEDRVAACEIGWKYLFPDLPVPLAITLIGRYDTWRQEEGDWKNETLPFKYYMYGIVNKPEDIPNWVFDVSYYPWHEVDSGKSIMKYQETMDESLALKNSFVREAYGLRALCINYSPFSSETLKSVYDPAKHDILIGFCYVGDKWSVSLRSIGDAVDVSQIAKVRGGGGHKNAAGFEVDEFKDIFI